MLVATHLQRQWIHVWLAKRSHKATLMLEAAQTRKRKDYATYAMALYTEDKCVKHCLHSPVHRHVSLEDKASAATACNALDFTCIHVCMHAV